MRSSLFENLKISLSSDSIDQDARSVHAERAFCVPSMFDSLEVQVLYPARWRRRVSEAQGRHREVVSKRSVEQTREPMNKNRI